jgi:hypothetical protein
LLRSYCLKPHPFHLSHLLSWYLKELQFILHILETSQHIFNILPEFSLFNILGASQHLFKLLEFSQELFNVLEENRKFFPCRLQVSMFL